MLQITISMPEQLVEELDAAVRRLGRSRSELLCQAVKAFLDDHEDLRIAAERLQDPSDPVLDWADVRQAEDGFPVAVPPKEPMVILTTEAVRQTVERLRQRQARFSDQALGD